MEEIPLIAASGPSFACGETVGRALADKIHANIAGYGEIFARHAGAGRNEVRRFAGKLAPLIEDYAPDLLDEMRGIAKGADAPLEDILALNARNEVMYALKGEGADECTSLAALPEVTGSGHTLIGQNWDWMASVAEHTAILALSIQEKPRLLVFTEAGFVGKAGFNEHGIGVCANLLTSTQDRGSIGVPYHVIVRRILAAPTLHRAIQAITLTRRGASGNFLIGARGGEVIDIEATPGDFGHVLPADGILTHSNHFLCPELGAVDSRKGVSALTLIRHDRARRLLAKEAGAIEPESFMAVLRDHFSFPHAICRHIDEADAPHERKLSAASIIMDLDVNEMYIAPGPPCEHDYRRIGLDAIHKEAAGLVTAN